MSRGNDMDLPDGKTCNDCAHWKRCGMFLSYETIDGNTHCDWSPSRFRLAAQQEQPHA